MLHLHQKQLWRPQQPATHQGRYVSGWNTELKLRAQLHANEPHITSTSAWTTCPFGHLGRFKSPQWPQAILSLWLWIQHKYIQIKFEKLWYPLVPLKFISSLLRRQISTSLWLHLSKSIYPFLNSSNVEVWNRFTLSKGGATFALPLWSVPYTEHTHNQGFTVVLPALFVFFPWAWV